MSKLYIFDPGPPEQGGGGGQRGRLTLPPSPHPPQSWLTMCPFFRRALQMCLFLKIFNMK